MIAGGKGWGSVLARPEADAAIRDGTVRLLGHVSDADLVALCSRAAAFAYVSLYEGFGLPVVEAMAAASPVLASSTTAVGELAAGAALLVDPQDEQAITAGLQPLDRGPGAGRAAAPRWARAVGRLQLAADDRNACSELAARFALRAWLGRSIGPDFNSPLVGKAALSGCPTAS